MWNSIFSRRKGPSGFSHSSTAEEVTEGIDGSGLIAIVTGASSGIGVETTRVLALRGVHVIMGVRNLSAGNDVKEEITKQNPNALVDIIKVDLSSITSVRKFVEEFSSQNLPLHILINNAGVMESKFTLSEDGIELSFATNHIGHFLLTDLLMENMKITAQKSGIEGRIINVSSDGYVLTYSEGIRFDKINEKTGYGGFSAYGQSKLANIFHAKELSSRLKEQGLNITANTLHPGFTTTNILRHWRFINGILAVIGKFVSKSVQQVRRRASAAATGVVFTSFLHHQGRPGPENRQGAATTCYMALHPQVRGVSGEYFEDCNLVELKPPATDQVLAKKLWEFSMDMIKGFDSSDACGKK